MSKIARWLTGLAKTAARGTGPRRAEPRLPPETLRQFADLLVRFESDPTIVFEKPGHAKGHVHKIIQGEGDAWKTEGKCFVCGGPTIKQSHTLQKLGPLAAIAENHEVLQPVAGLDGAYAMKSIRIRSASTFPGFCERHEGMFSSFETRKKIDTDSDIALQAFRMVCREMFRLKHEAEFLEGQLADYTKRKFDYVVGNLTGDVPTGSKVMLSDDKKESSIKAMIELKKRDHDALQDGLYKDFQSAIAHNTPMEAVFRSIDVPDVYPVCMSGLGRLRVKDDGAEIDTEILFGVIPSDTGTTIIIVSPRRGRKALEYYFDRCLISQNRWGVLDQIEAWMLYHTDHWFIRPSAWSALPSERRKAICALMREDMLVGLSSPTSIFDDIRKELIKGAEKLPEYPHDLDLQEKVRTERAKMAALPPQVSRP